jgi:hypothetical protein
MTRWTAAITSMIVLVHFALLALSIPDYRVTIDSAYHVSMARIYSQHWLVPWDYLNFGPTGRPNLQGPLLYIVMAALGRMLGGNGNDFVLANAILSVTQWGAAVATVGFFACQLSGAWALLLAIALFSGAGFAATSFAVGIPSGWLFILTPWAIYFFMRGRVVLCALATTAAIYVHIGGSLTVPVGLAIAALLTGRWRTLFQVGVLTAILTAPYTLHVVSYLGWFSGVSSRSALLIDPMLDTLALIGAMRLFRSPRHNAFIVAWLCAPIAWLFQDMGRFILQSALAGSVAASLLIVDLLERIADVRRRTILAIGTAAIATLIPFGPPALGAEAAWDAGLRYPRAINWNRARLLEGYIERAGLDDHLVADYMPLLCPALAVFGPARCEKGDWVEVQPLHDPADDLLVGNKVYILPLARDDPALLAVEKRGWVTIHGATSQSVMVTFSRTRPALAPAAALSGQIMVDEARWLAANIINNAITLRGWHRIISQTAMRRFRCRLRSQRRHAGRIELAALIYAWTLEPVAPQQARRMRRAARGFGVIASFLGDDFALDFLSNSRIAKLKSSLRLLSLRASALEHDPMPTVALMESFEGVIKSALVTRGQTFAERPPEDSMPWLPRF